MSELRMRDGKLCYFIYRSTRCFFLESAAGGALVAIDAGWPCTLYEYARSMKTIGYHLEDVKWAFVTHFHMDHAGLFGAFIERGIECFVFENQAPSIDSMEKTIRKNYPEYTPIEKSALRPVTTAGSRELLGELGIAGQVIVTDYHSPDSVTFISDFGAAVVGDLPAEEQRMPDDDRIRAVWQRIRRTKARSIYPSHAELYELSGSADESPNNRTPE